MHNIYSIYILPGTHKLRYRFCQHKAMFFYFPAVNTMTSPEATLNLQTSPLSMSSITNFGTSPAMVTYPSTDNVALPITSSPAVSQSGSDMNSILTSETVPSYQLSNCTLFAASSSVNTCPNLQPDVDISLALAYEIPSTLLDDDLTTCLRPYQVYHRLSLALDIQCTWRSPLLRIHVTGEGLDCTQPSTVVYLDLKENPAALSNNVSKQECPFMSSNRSEAFATCIYECRRLNPCDSSVRIGLLVQRFSWLARSQHLERLCDIRAYIWI